MDKIIKKRKWYIRNMPYIAGGLLLTLIVLYLLLFADRSRKLNVDTEKIIVEEVIYDDFQDYIAVIATVEPIKTIYLDALEGGRVEEIIIDEGNMVKADDAILKLSNPGLMLEISNYEAQVAQAVSGLRNARMQMQLNQLNLESQIIDMNYKLSRQAKEFKNNKLFIQDSLISEDEFEDTRDLYKSSRQKMKLLEKNQKQDSMSQRMQIRMLETSANRLEDNLDIVRKRIENLVVRAPVDGELATIDVEEGQVIGYGTRIGKINILDSYKLKVEIDEHYISRVSKGLTARCDFADKMYEAEIVKIYAEVNNGRFAVDMEFTNDVPKKLRIGQTSRVKLELGDSQKSLLIRAGGFYQSTGGQWVFVVDDNGDYAIKRNIRIGRQNPRYFEVLDGLNEGEKVITSNYDSFGDVEKLVLKH